MRIDRFVFKLVHRDADPLCAIADLLSLRSFPKDGNGYLVTLALSEKNKANIESMDANNVAWFLQMFGGISDKAVIELSTHEEVEAWQ